LPSKNHEQPAASSKMFFRKLKNFLLLLPQSKGSERSLIPISDIKFF
jgi:hypothetical protein